MLRDYVLALFSNRTTINYFFFLILEKYLPKNIFALSGTPLMQINFLLAVLVLYLKEPEPLILEVMLHFGMYRSANILRIPTICEEEVLNELTTINTIYCWHCFGIHFYFENKNIKLSAAYTVSASESSAWIYLMCRSWVQYKRLYWRVDGHLSCLLMSIISFLISSPFRRDW